MTTISLTPARYSKFDAKVDRNETGCHLWTAAIQDNGYGIFFLDGKKMYAHRIAYALSHSGEIPDGKMIDHVCHVRHCVNPLHLRAVTNKENAENQGRHTGRETMSGVRGVHRNGKGWRGVVRHNYEMQYTTTYRTIEEASVAVVALRRRLFHEQHLG